MALKQKSTNTPITVVIASVFIILCAFALIAFAIILVIESLRVPNNPIYSTQPQSKGFITVTFLILIAAGSLFHGVRKLLTTKQPNYLIFTLGVPLAIGTVGQTIDIIGNASTQSNLVGFGILLMFAIPIVLLKLPPSVKCYTKSP